VTERRFVSILFDLRKAFNSLTLVWDKVRVRDKIQVNSFLLIFPNACEQE